MDAIMDFLSRAGRDEPVYITEVRRCFAAQPGVDLWLDLSLFDSSIRRFPLRIPLPDDREAAAEAFVLRYLYAEVYNLLSALGGSRLDMYTPSTASWISSLSGRLDAAFGLFLSRKDRPAYGRCLNVIERMLESEGRPARFVWAVHPGVLPPPLPLARPETVDFTAGYQAALSAPAGKLVCGLDIGGTDIKMGVCDGGRLCHLAEFDWFPAGFTRVDQLVDPIVQLVRMLRVRVSLDHSQKAPALRQALDQALRHPTMDRKTNALIEEAEAALKTDLRSFDSIGLCFPDVVIRDKIVGGEVFKLRGIRSNPDTDFEAAFHSLTNLGDRLQALCVPGGAVRITNDGSMAAFTAALELVAQGELERLRDGRFAHTLGTELGTGWVDETGHIPEIPLEVYNFIIDLGTDAAQAYPPDDLRSINNFNTGLPGTLQKFLAQNGVFRLAIKFSLASDGALYRAMLQQGMIAEGKDGVFVVLSPKDMRKPLLEFLMQRCEAGDPVMEQVFLTLGYALGITFKETQWVLGPRTNERILYGRMVKSPRCFELLRQGALQAAPEQVLSVAGEQSACSALMVQLQQHSTFTVAQFAQTVGAIYYGLYV